MARLALMLFMLDEAARLDEQEAQQRRERLRNARKLPLYKTLIHGVTDEVFIKKYTLPKSLFLELVEKLWHLIKKPSRRSDLAVKTKILIALSFYATGSFQKSYKTYMTQQSVSNCIKEVTEALNDPSIFNYYINMPATVEERNVIKAKFEEKYNMPGILGCVDATHIAIKRPKEYEGQYLNRKRYYSKNVQIVCDYDLNILSADASYGGATYDALIFNQHYLGRHLQDLNNQGETTYLLGDSGYDQREYMMTPILKALVGSPEELYNKNHAAAREKVEQTICLLKARWRCLLKPRILHYKPDMVTNIVNACCVLHNFCNRAGLSPPQNLQETKELIVDEQPDMICSTASLSNDVGNELKGLEARQRLVNMLWYKSSM